MKLSPPTSLLLVALGCGSNLGIAPPPSGTAPTGQPEPGEPVPLCEVGGAVAICLDEAQASNDSTIQHSPAVFPDWIELVNEGDEPVEPGRIAVRVGGSDRVSLEGAPPLEPGERWLLFVDPEAEGAVPTRIGSDGDMVEIFVDGRLSDRVELPAMGSDLAWGRYTDGPGISCEPSPGLPNGPSVACADIRDWVFRDGAIHEFFLTLEPDAWATLETSTTFYHPSAIAALSFDGGEFPLVEVSIKGGYGSFRGDLDTQKSGFKIDLNTFRDHRWRGLRKLTLNNMVQDPTFTHEALTYRLYRELGMPAPRVAYARVHLNGVYMGFYALIEAVDTTFLEDWYSTGDGHLFEAAYGPDFDPGEEWSFDYDSGPDEIAGRAAITAVIDTLALGTDETTYAQLRTQVDMDQWMLNMAIEAAVWHWDGYWTENNNRMYQDPATGLWTIIPHGTDQTWVDGWPNPYDPSAQPRLYDFCMNVPSCRAMYGDALRQVADAVDATPLEAELDRLVALTEPEFLVDPRAEETGNHQSQIDGTRVRIQTVAGALRAAAQ